MTTINDRTAADHDTFAAELARLEAAPAAPEAFDAVAAVRRVWALAEELEDVARDYRHAAGGSHDAGARNAHMAIARHIRDAIAGPTP